MLKKLLKKVEVQFFILSYLGVVHALKYFLGAFRQKYLISFFEAQGKNKA